MWLVACCYHSILSRKDELSNVTVRGRYFHGKSCLLQALRQHVYESRSVSAVMLQDSRIRNVREMSKSEIRTAVCHAQGSMTKQLKWRGKHWIEAFRLRGAQTTKFLAFAPS